MNTVFGLLFDGRTPGPFIALWWSRYSSLGSWADTSPDWARTVGGVLNECSVFILPLCWHESVMLLIY